MKKNALALNIGEEILIEGFGIVRCTTINIIKNLCTCNKCCMSIKGHCKSITITGYIPYCVKIDREHNNLNNSEKLTDSIIYTRVTAVVKLKDIKL